MIKKIFRVFINLINPRTTVPTARYIIARLKQNYEINNLHRISMNFSTECRTFFQPALFDEESARKLIEHADKAVNKTFYILGDWVSFEDEIRWHDDFFRNHTFDPEAYYPELRKDIGPGRDIKVPWELSRFSHAPQLALAYYHTGKDKYLSAFEEQVLDWVEKNPWKYGVNWTCAMDVAIRACNWLLAYDIFTAAGARFSDDFKRAFFTSIFFHGKHIYANLEWSPFMTSNHYLSDIVGLFYLGCYLSDSPLGRKWLSFARRELEKEMQNQVYPDGMDFEGSVCYHRLVFELFFFAAVLAQKSGVKLSDAFYERLKKMADFIYQVVKPDGTAPQIGDNDSGRLHIVFPREVLDFTYLYSLSAIFFNDEKYAVEEFGLAPEALVFFGEEARARWEKFSKKSVRDIPSALFENGGIAVLRSGYDYLVVSAGELGQKGRGGHDHNDKLSFELMIDGKNFIVDPGTGFYTPEPNISRTLQSTRSHSTICINGLEQNTFHTDNVWTYENETHARITDFRIEEGRMVVSAEHSGYSKIDPSIVVKRTFIFEPQGKRLELIDEITGKSEVELEWNFILAPEVEVSSGEGITLKNDAVSIKFLHPEELDFSVDENLYSPEYGKVSKTKKLTARKKVSLPYKSKFLFQA